MRATLKVDERVKADMLVSSDWICDVSGYPGEEALSLSSKRVSGTRKLHKLVYWEYCTTAQLHNCTTAQLYNCSSAN